MLTAAQFDELTLPITAMYEQLVDSIIADIARRVARLSAVTEASAWQAQRAIEAGALYTEVLAKLSAMTGQTEAALNRAFRDAGLKTLKFDDAIYRAAGLNPLPLNMSPAMVQTLLAGLQKTKAALSNFTMTTAQSAQKAFFDAANAAHAQIVSGAFSYEQAVRSAVKGAAATGLQTVQFASGHTDELSVAMRRAVMTGVSQTAATLQTQRADEMGADLVETSAHGGARPSHAQWQGQVFSRSGSSKKYKPFVESTGYGTGPGLCGWNCRHSFFPFFEGLSERNYRREDLNRYKTQTITVNGKKMTLYDATQVQRQMERYVREWKRQADALGTVGFSNIRELTKVREWQAALREFTSKTGLPRQYAREGGRVTLQRSSQAMGLKIENTSADYLNQFSRPVPLTAEHQYTGSVKVFKNGSSVSTGGDAVLARNEVSRLMEAHTEARELGLIKQVYKTEDDGSFVRLYGSKTMTREQVLKRVGAFYDSVNGRIVFKPGAWRTDMFDHEVGHAIWKEMKKRGYSQQPWVDAYTKKSFDRHTNYAATAGVEEAFCETYMAWIASGRSSSWDSFNVLAECFALLTKRAMV